MMNKLNNFATFCLIVQMITSIDCSLKSISCEKFENHLWKTDHDQLETCYIQHQAVDAPGFSISSLRDENITGLWFDDNKNMFFLPENISQKYPNLLGLSAERCSVKFIGKVNLKGLRHLKYLWITGSPLERISSDSFEDLVSLERLYLYNNNIKYMNGDIFANSPKLQRVDLVSNSCINENFNADKIVILSDELTKRCGTISEATMERFINDWKIEALKKNDELFECVNRSEGQAKYLAIKNIYERLSTLIQHQERQQTLLENFYKDIRIKEQNLQVTNDKLKHAEIEILELRKKIESLEKKTK